MGCMGLPFALLTERDMAGRCRLAMALDTYSEVPVLFTLHQGRAVLVKGKEEKKKFILITLAKSIC